jgi:hypothetical protein
VTKDERIYMMGLTVSIQGLQETEALVREELAERRLKLAALEQRAAGTVLPRIDPIAALPEPAAKKKRKGYAKDNYWAKLSPEERSIEMMRRMSKRAGRQKKNRVSLKGRAAISAAQKKRWAKTKRKPTVKMAVLSLQQLDKLHPRDSRSPRHEAWLETMRVAQLKRWGSMTKAERKARQVAMLAGRQNKVSGVATL